MKLSNQYTNEERHNRRIARQKQQEQSDLEIMNTFSKLADRLKEIQDQKKEEMQQLEAASEQVRLEDELNDPEHEEQNNDSDN